MSILCKNLQEPWSALVTGAALLRGDYRKWIIRWPKALKAGSKEIRPAEGCGSESPWGCSPSMQTHSFIILKPT